MIVRDFVHIAYCKIVRDIVQYNQFRGTAPQPG